MSVRKSQRRAARRGAQKRGDPLVGLERALRAQLELISEYQKDLSANQQKLVKHQEGFIHPSKDVLTALQIYLQVLAGYFDKYRPLVYSSDVASEHKIRFDQEMRKQIKGIIQSCIGLTQDYTEKFKAVGLSKR